MFDFLKVVKTYQKERYHYKPTFIIKSSIKDIMTRGGNFYAIFDEESGLWTKSKPRAIELIDMQVREFAIKDAGPESMSDTIHGPHIQYMADSSNMLSTQFDRFCKTMGDNWIALDQKMIFSNTDVKKSDYASKSLDYPLVETQTPYYDTICSILYSPDEQEKWEWAVGSMIAGEQNRIQKMFAFYGEPGTGKSTIISKIFAEQIFGGLDMGYAVKFEANNVVGGDSFGTDFLENDSVLVYDDDAELGVINCRSTLNKIISHESIRVNCKFKSPFMTKSNCMIFIGSNDPIQLSPNSGMKRRLIDIRPTGILLDHKSYDECIEHIPFEKSGIAWKCLQVYKTKGRHYYDHYVAEDMLNRTSPFHNFVTENVMELKDGVTLAKAYDMYVAYAEACKFKNVIVRYKFRDTLKLYFDTYTDAKFEGFRWEKIGQEKPKSIEINTQTWLEFNSTESLLDELYSDYPAQYANEEGFPKYKWENVKTLLKNIDTSKLHYVKPPINHIIIDFDIKGEDGNKSFEKNLLAASKFPPTYAELSKSGEGIHLHYIYTGDPTELSRIFDNNVEIKVFNGNSSLRRLVTLCNTLAVATISSGLPFKETKGDKNVLDGKGFKNETKLKHTIIKALRNCDKDSDMYGKVLPNLTPSHKCTIDFIDMLLKDAYRSGRTYDCRDLQQTIITFALESTHKSDYCMDLVSNMHFCSKDVEDASNPIDTENYISDDRKEIVFFDTEVSPSYKQYEEYCKKYEIPINESIPKDTPAHFLICYKFKDKDGVIKMLDPKPEEVQKLFNYGLIGFNNRSYDNHMCYAASQGYSPEELYTLNCRIIDKQTSKESKFAQAYNLSKTDILDFASSGNKKGLKKFEIELGERHLEWDRPWYEPIPNNRLMDWCEYCTNDVISTEKVFYHLQEDYEARQILALLAGCTENDTTNTLTTKLLTDGIDNPQKDYIYTDLSTIFPGYRYDPNGIPKEEYSTKEGTKISTRKSIYMGEDPSEGGYANCPKPGIYFHVGLMDIISMHPHSAIKLNIFGHEITKRFEALVEARVCIKHIKTIEDENYIKAIEWLEILKIGASKIFISIVKGLEGDKLKKKCKAIANALKTAINSVYGLTSAKFDNKLRDPKNIDNIVAKYGALFMITLKHAVEEQGYTVVHIKTDSIKIANFDDNIKKFVNDFGKRYGYTFEHEATYNRICIVDDSQYVAYEEEADGEKLEKPFWTVTGAKFASPYLFKTLFSHEEIEFKDYCETKSVSDAAIHLLYPDGGNRFIGRVGSFVCTIDGGTMMRVQGNKMGAVVGTKGYLWSEAEHVNDFDKINMDYYRANIDDAVECINQYGNFDDFVNLIA